MPEAVEDLWTPAELAKFLGYAESTITRLTNKPGALPPRVAGLAKPRWLPSACRQWAQERTGSAAPQPRRKRGRPRRNVGGA